MLIIVHDFSQMRKEYEEEGVKIFINSKIKIATTQNDQETTKWPAMSSRQKQPKLKIQVDRVRISLM